MSGYAMAQLELATLAHQRDERERAITAAVAHYRANGVPWSVIGEALGVTKQAAQQRYGTGKSTV